MNEPQTKTIDGHEFQVSQLPGMRGLKVFTRLSKVLGAGLAGAFGAKTNEERGVALLSLLQHVDEADVEYVTKELFSVALVKPPDSEKFGPVNPVFDRVFQGRIDLLFKALVFALQVNYGDFFKGLGAAAAGAAAAQAAPSTSSSPKA